MGLAQELARSLGRDEEIHETHVSWVILAGGRAYKLKKPLRYPFVDQSTAELRRALCDEEVRVNQALAAPIVRGVAAVVRGRRGLELRSAGSPGALDHVVVMRRFHQNDTLAARLAGGRVDDEQLRAVGAVLAGFHARAATANAGEDPARRWLRNLAELSECLSGAVPGTLEALEGFGPAQARRWSAHLAGRAARGLAVDGHGDLRAEHILLEDDRVLIVDRLEFDAGLRCGDVAEDLAFLTMDLERLDARWAAERVLAGYAAAGGDAGPPELLAFFAAYRALVRAKVAALSGRMDQALGLVALATTLSWRARRPLRIIVTGPPASGKSTLSSAIAVVARVPHVGSDSIRPRDAQGRGRYDARSRADVYRNLGHAARDLDSYVIDATFGDLAMQEAFLDAAGPLDHVTVVECAAPDSVLLTRAARRPSGAGSEAGPAVTAALLERHVPFSVRGASRLHVDTTADTVAIVAQVARWLDRSHS